MMRWEGREAECVDFANHNSESAFYFKCAERSYWQVVCRSDLDLVFLSFILDAGMIKIESGRTDDKAVAWIQSVCSRGSGEQRSGSGCTLRAEGIKLPELLCVVCGDGETGEKKA